MDPEPSRTEQEGRGKDACRIFLPLERMQLLGFVWFFGASLFRLGTRSTCLA
jgi:hypothetical protein